MEKLINDLMKMAQDGSEYANIAYDLNHNLFSYEGRTRSHIDKINIGIVHLRNDNTYNRIENDISHLVDLSKNCVSSHYYKYLKKQLLSKPMSISKLDEIMTDYFFSEYYSINDALIEGENITYTFRPDKNIKFWLHFDVSDKSKIYQLPHSTEVIVTEITPSLS